MGKRQAKQRRRERKQERKFKQEGRRLERRKKDREIEFEKFEQMTPQEQREYKAHQLAKQLGWEVFNV